MERLELIEREKVCVRVVQVCVCVVHVYVCEVVCVFEGSVCVFGGGGGLNFVVAYKQNLSPSD